MQNFEHNLVTTLFFVDVDKYRFCFYVPIYYQNIALGLHSLISMLECSDELITQYIYSVMRKCHCHPNEMSIVKVWSVQQINYT